MNGNGGSRFQQLLQDLRDCHLQEVATIRNEFDELKRLHDFKDGTSAAMPDPLVFKSIGAEATDLDEGNVQRQISGAGTQEESENGSKQSNFEIAPRRMSKAETESVESKYPLRDLWKDVGEEALDRLSLSRNRSFLNLNRQAKEDMKQEIMTEEDDVDADLAGYWKRLIGYPGSHIRLAWDLLGGLLILWDLITIPIKAFNPPEEAFVAMDMTCLLFWTFNVPATLTVGYVDQGMTIMTPTKIAKNYLKTWFWVDLATLGPDWFFFFLASGDGDTMKLLRSLRLVRTVRLLRLAKLKKLMEAINDYLDSEYSTLVFAIVKMMIVLVMVNHVIACLWFLLGTETFRSEGESWTNFYVEGLDWPYQYLYSLHWSLTQFTPAGMEVGPKNAQERLFAIGTVIFALIGFSYVVGSITGSITQIRQLSEQASKDFWLLRRFLKQNNVEITLSGRIQRFLEHAYSRDKKKMTMGSVKVLGLLSKQLMEELNCAINLPHLSVHPLFRFLSKMAYITMNKTAKEAVSRMHLARGDTLFVADQEASSMYFLVNGRMEYSRQLEETWTDQVTAGSDWMSELVLWTLKWHHVGEAKALSEVDVLLVDPKVFEAILQAVKPVANIVSQYGRKFVEWVISMEVDGEPLSDLIRGQTTGPEGQDQTSDHYDQVYSFIPEAMTRIDRTSSASIRGSLKF